MHKNQNPPVVQRRGKLGKKSSPPIIPQNQSIHQVFLMRYAEQELTDYLQILEKAGYTGDVAIFMMGWAGGVA